MEPLDWIPEPPGASLWGGARARDVEPSLGTVSRLPGSESRDTCVHQANVHLCSSDWKAAGPCAPEVAPILGAVSQAWHTQAVPENSKPKGVPARCPLAHECPAVLFSWAFPGRYGLDPTLPRCSWMRPDVSS